MKKLITLIIVAIFGVVVAQAEWEKYYFVDDFGDRTNNSFFADAVVGRFSNVATNNNPLCVSLVVDGDHFYFYISKYCSYKVYSYDDQLVDIKVKYEDGSTYTISEVYISSTGAVFASEFSSDYDRFNDLPYNKCKIFINYDGSDYNFSIKRTLD